MCMGIVCRSSVSGVGVVGTGSRVKLVPLRSSSSQRPDGAM